MWKINIFCFKSNLKNLNFLKVKNLKLENFSLKRIPTKEGKSYNLYETIPRKSENNGLLPPITINSLSSPFAKALKILNCDEKRKFDSAF